MQEESKDKDNIKKSRISLKFEDIISSRAIPHDFKLNLLISIFNPIMVTIVEGCAKYHWNISCSYCVVK